MNYGALSRNGVILAHEIRSFIDEPRMLRRDVERGTLVRLRRGVYAEQSTWEAADDRQKHILRVRAVLAVAERAPVIAGVSAAAVWGMPIAELFPIEVTILDEWRGGGRSEPGVRRTAAGFRSARSTVRDGVPVTDLARTALDVARAHRFDDAVGSVDWALWRRNPVAISPLDLAAELELLQPRCKRLHLERVAGFATPLSGSFGESKARAVIRMLGFEDPELQVEFHDGEGRVEVDFLWRGARIIGEFDGKQKYTNTEFNHGDPADVAWREKRREDRLRRLGFMVVRIVWSDLEDPRRLERLLLAAGVPRRGGSH